MPRTPLARSLLVAGLMLAAASGLRAGPPFLTDDPEPVDFRHWEFYLFAMGDRSADGDVLAAPAVEVNYGLAPEVQLHLVAPVTDASAAGSGWKSGPGDAEFGVKVRIVDETDSRPQVGVFPAVELATGDSARGLGNGRTWWRLPVWLQKSWGPWTTYGGGGVALNSAPGQRNYEFEGWLVQRNLGKYLTLGTELFHQGASQAGGRGFTVADAGGSINFTENFNLLFSGGHSISGERQVVWYLGLYWTWGPNEPSR
jgi:hypothetical protein